jgi:pimeloyl-ACP methyl ester carboxylesterase
MRSDAKVPDGLLRRTGVRALLLTPVVAGAALTLPYVMLNDEPETLDAAVRSAAGGTFLELSGGHTRYEVAGDDRGRLLVLVHGTTIPSFVWDRNFRPLVTAGHRVIRYDLYGRGLSDRPDGRYDLEMYVTQLDELVERLAPGREIDLAGFSLGGLVVAEYARRHPERIGKIVLIAPAGVGAKLPKIAKLAITPGVGEYIMRVAGTRQLRPSRRNLLHPENHEGFDAAYEATIRYAGSRRAVLQTLRHAPIDGYESGYRELALLGKPLLLVWGREDGVVPFERSSRVRELLRPAAFVPVDGAGHAVQYERPDEVNEAMITFLGAE